VGTEVGTAETTTPQDFEQGVPTFNKKTDKTFFTNVSDSEKKSDLPNKDEKKVLQTGVEVGTPPRTIPETLTDSSLPTVPTSEVQNNIEAKAEQLREALDNKANADAIDMLIFDWSIGERKQVENLLGESYREQLRKLMG
jgi:hypothetical protein